MPNPGLPLAAVFIGDGLFIVEVADTPESRRQGLSWRESLGPANGMWFDLGETRSAAFWMYGMQFPLDIIWITEDLRVAGVAAHTPPADPSAPQADLPRYPSPVPVRYVLEINAGYASALGIEAGAQAWLLPLKGVMHPLVGAGVMHTPFRGQGGNRYTLPHPPQRRRR